MVSRRVTLVDALLPDKAVVRDVGVIGACVGLTALAAQAAVRLPFTPVPATGQTFAVLLSGVVLGSRRGASASIGTLWHGHVGVVLGHVHLSRSVGRYQCRRAPWDGA